MQLRNKSQIISTFQNITMNEKRKFSDLKDQNFLTNRSHLLNVKEIILNAQQRSDTNCRVYMRMRCGISKLFHTKTQ